MVGKAGRFFVGEQTNSFGQRYGVRMFGDLRPSKRAEGRFRGHIALPVDLVPNFQQSLADWVAQPIPRFDSQITAFGRSETLCTDLRFTRKRKVTELTVSRKAEGFWKVPSALSPRPNTLKGSGYPGIPLSLCWGLWGSETRVSGFGGGFQTRSEIQHPLRNVLSSSNLGSQVLQYRNDFVGNLILEGL